MKSLEYVNSEGERIAIKVANRSEFRGRLVLVLYDADPPKGTWRKASMLLDSGAMKWLVSHLTPELIAETERKEAT